MLRTLISLALVSFVFLIQGAYAGNLARIVCEYTHPNKPKVSLHALAQPGTEMELVGEWLVDDQGQLYFESTRSDYAEISKLCEDSMRIYKLRGYTVSGFSAKYSDVTEKTDSDNQPTTESAKLSSQLESNKESLIGVSHPIRFKKTINQENLGNISSSLVGIIGNDFYQFSKELLMDHWKEDFLADTLLREVRRDPKAAAQSGSSYLQDAIRYEQPPLEFRAETPEDRILEFAERFAGTADLKIIAHHFSGDNAVCSRGAFNSYVDWISDSFQPQNVRRNKNLPSIYDPNDPRHELALALLNAFGPAAAVKGHLERYSKIRDDNNIEEMNDLILGYKESTKILLGRLKELRESVALAKIPTEKLDSIIERLEGTLDWVVVF